MLSIIFISSSIFQIIIILLILSKGLRKLPNVFFAGLVLGSIGWTLTNFLILNLENNEQVVGILRLLLMFVVIQNTFFYLFARTFPRNNWDHSIRGLVLYLIFSLIVVMLTLSNLVFSEAKIVDDIPVSSTGPLMPLFGLHSTISIVVAISVLYKKVKKAPTFNIRKQMQLLLAASVLNWTIVPVTNFILTPLLKSTFFIALSPVYTLLFSSFIAYSILAHKFLDVRTFMSRSVSYMMLISFSVIFITTSLLLGFSLFLQDASPNFELLLSLSIATVVISFITSPLKNRIDKVTNRIFFRDSYDPQVALNNLSSILSSEIQLDVILSSTFNLLNDTYMPISAAMTVIGPKGLLKTVNSGVKDLSEIVKKLENLPQDTLIVDDMESGSPKEFLKDRNIELFAKLKNQNEEIGYVLLGTKKSGSTYTSQDEKTINVAATELAISISNSIKFEQIKEFNLTLQKKIDKATKNLKKNNEKLKALDEAKDEFISMASHQLRTPLTSVKGYVSMVMEGDAGKISPKQEELLQSAFASSQRMVYLIADLLNVSRLRTGKFIIETKEVDLPDVVESEIDQLKETAKSRKLKLTYKKPKNFPKVMLDETKIRQVIMNFADNAIYYTPSGGEIEIILESDKNSVTYKVVDNGIGVPKEEQHKLFTKFYRAGNAKKARPDGTGLGLFMAKKVVVSQGGAIVFNSKPGKGSTFGFTFPLKDVGLKKTKSTKSPKQTKSKK